MVANVGTEPLGSAFAYAGDYVKDSGYYHLSNLRFKFKKNFSYVSYDSQATRIVANITKTYSKTVFHTVRSVGRNLNASKSIIQ